jgi:hypothetical protein
LRTILLFFTIRADPGRATHALRARRKIGSAFGGNHKRRDRRQ